MNRIYTIGASLAMLASISFSATAQQSTVSFGVDPADGATVKTINRIVLTLPCVDDTYESQLWPDMEKAATIAVLKGDETVATFESFDEATGDDEGNIIFPIILSDDVTGAGEYTFSLPEGLFVQMRWDDSADDMVAVTDGKITEAYTAKVTVDPNIKSAIDIYNISPEPGSSVESIAEVTIGFPQISAGTMFDGWEFPNATFSNGTTTVEAIVNYDWNSEEEYRVMKVTPVDANEEEAPITEEGKWTLTIAAGTFVLNGNSNAEITAEFNIASTAEPTTVEFGVDPANGATVKSISRILLTLPCVDDTFESQLWPDMEKAATIAVLKGDETVATFESFDEATGDDEGNIIFPIILSDAVTEAGEYTFSLPEGLFVQMRWDDATDDFVTVKGGSITAAYTAKVTVDPAIKTEVDVFTITPESGTTVESIAEVTIGFPQISAGTMFDGWEFPNATFSNGTTTVEAIVNYDWNSEEEYRVMKVTPVDANEEEAPITEEGKWTLTIAAGTFVLNGNSNAEITAEFNIASTAEPTTVEFGVDPADGASVKSISRIVLTLPCVDDTFESQLWPDMEKAATIAVLKGDETVATFESFDEATGDDEGNIIFPIILSNAVTEAGEYTFSLPEGLFVQMRWDDAADDFVTVKGGSITAAYTAKVTVDPAIKTEVDVFTITPESGTTVESIAEVTIGFPQISAGTMFDGWEFPNAAFSNGTTTIEAIVNYDWNSEEEYRVMKVTPVDANEEEAPITEEGKWTLTIAAGTFVLNGNSNAEITAEFTVKKPSSGVETIDAELNGNVTVCSVDGKVILNNVPSTQLSTLRKGLYIINGKKVAIK